MNETIKPYLTAKGNSAGNVEKMHRAWCKSLQLQIALGGDLCAKLTPTEVISGFPSGRCAQILSIVRSQQVKKGSLGSSLGNHAS